MFVPNSQTLRAGKRSNRHESPVNYGNMTPSFTHQTRFRNWQKTGLFSLTCRPFRIRYVVAVRIGPLTLQSNLFLSPLAGYTNLPFRLVVREIGGVGLCTTDLVNARSLLEKREKAFKLIETRPADSPLAVQLFGSVPEEMRDAAQLLEARGVAAVDVNMGCPVRKVCNVGGGSAMMTELDKTSGLVRAMVCAVKIPVTAKMRLGWDDENLTAPDLAHAEDAGVAAIFVHGRTRAQGFGGTVNLAGIRAVVQAVKTIPVIGNGNVITPQARKRCSTKPAAPA
jgi:tRNA-dihydrouridine synthase B